jgi:hypothetical protein
LLMLLVNQGIAIEYHRFSIWYQTNSTGFQIVPKI